MYIWALILMLGVPLALASWRGLLMLALGVLALVWRILDEEKFLERNLAGYKEYKSKVRYRLVPSV